MYKNTTGNCNTAVGYQALYANTSGASNVAIGQLALLNNTVGFSNTAIGREAMRANTTGVDNTAVGIVALYKSTGCWNTAVGSNALACLTTGTCNIAMGTLAGSTITTASNTISIGTSTNPANTTGHTVWGNSGNNLCNCVYKAWELASDCRDKANIQTLPTKLGLQFINKLRPVSFNWDYRDTYVRECKYSYGEKDGSFISEKKSYGVIAQELKQVLEDLQVDFDGLGHDAEKDAYRIGYEELIAPIIKSIQELVAENQEIKDRLTTLENK